MNFVRLGTPSLLMCDCSVFLLSGYHLNTTTSPWASSDWHSLSVSLVRSYVFEVLCFVWLAIHISTAFIPGLLYPLFSVV